MSPTQEPLVGDPELRRLKVQLFGFQVVVGLLAAAIVGIGVYLASVGMRHPGTVTGIVIVPVPHDNTTSYEISTPNKVSRAGDRNELQVQLAAALDEQHAGRGTTRAPQEGRGRDLVWVGAVVTALGCLAWSLMCWLGANLAVTNFQYMIWRLGGSALPPPDATVHPVGVVALIEDAVQVQDQLLPRRIGLIGNILIHELMDKVYALGVSVGMVRPAGDEKGTAIILAFDRFIAHLAALRSWLRYEPEGNTFEIDELPEIDLTEVITQGNENWSGQHIMTDTDCSVRPLVRGLEQLVAAVVDNLVRNAVQHNDELEQAGGLRVLVSVWVTDLLPDVPATNGTTRGQSPPRWAIVRVADNGRSIVGDRRARLFTITDESPTHGIGLAFSRAVVRSLKGDLRYWDPSIGRWPLPTVSPDPAAGGDWFKRRRGKAFWFYLPLAVLPRLTDSTPSETQ